MDPNDFPALPGNEWVEAMFRRARTREAAVDGKCLFVDAGAHWGEETIYAGKLGCQVLAFEPGRQNAAKMIGLAEMQPPFAKPVQYCNSVLSDSDGEMAFIEDGFLGYATSAAGETPGSSMSSTNWRKLLTTSNSTKNLNSTVDITASAKMS
ncbi:hypothetical protein CYMTET_53118 [Cymbomonas tetramitiformis]|uniref:Uncharacterized protein n=1 Tax=Cymbomonas tetramitiformis TaxID=36881 RepID=A0AAE0BHK0_9CHLO|nr:hypothetical protein CYMTET_53118 [Cymbomonas tetramitiformis]